MDILTKDNDHFINKILETKTIAFIPYILLFIFFAEKSNKNKHKISIVCQVNNNRHIRTQNALLDINYRYPSPYFLKHHSVISID